MTSILEAARQALNATGWPVTESPEPPELRTVYRGQKGEFIGFIRLDQAAGLFAFYSAAPAIPPAERRLAVAEYLTRANSALMLGNFEMDLAGGAALFKTSALFEADPSPDVIKRLLEINVETMDMYLPGLLAVSAGDLRPAEAIARIEGGHGI